MGCQRYGPLISRFLDDDLGKEELEGLLEHFLLCKDCTREWKGMEGVRSWFQTVDLLDPPPQPGKAFSLEDLDFNADYSLEDVFPGEPLIRTLRGGARLLGQAGRPARTPVWGAVLQRLVPQRSWRFAVPMIAGLMLGIWAYPETPEDMIDVRDLPISRSMTAHISNHGGDTESMDLYVLRHSTLQPRANYGSEHHLIQSVSAAYP